MTNKRWLDHTPEEREAWRDGVRYAGWFWVSVILLSMAFAALVGCAPRYRADDPSIFGRQEVLERIAR